jgi:hypothetical protein
MLPSARPLSSDADIKKMLVPPTRRTQEWLSDPKGRGRICKTKPKEKKEKYRTVSAVFLTWYSLSNPIHTHHVVSKGK